MRRSQGEHGAVAILLAVAIALVGGILLSVMRTSQENRHAEAYAARRAAEARGANAQALELAGELLRNEVLVPAGGALVPSNGKAGAANALSCKSSSGSPWCLTTNGAIAIKSCGSNLPADTAGALYGKANDKAPLMSDCWSSYGELDTLVRVDKVPMNATKIEAVATTTYSVPGKTRTLRTNARLTIPLTPDSADICTYMAPIRDGTYGRMVFNAQGLAGVQPLHTWVDPIALNVTIQGGAPAGVTGEHYQQWLQNLQKLKSEGFHLASNQITPSFPPPLLGPTLAIGSETDGSLVKFMGYVYGSNSVMTSWPVKGLDDPTTASMLKQGCKAVHAPDADFCTQILYTYQVQHSIYQATLSNPFGPPLSATAPTAHNWNAYLYIAYSNVRDPVKCQRAKVSQCLGPPLEGSNGCG